MINRRLDYIFISNKLQEFSNDTNIIPAFKTHHSSFLATISNYNFFKPGPGLWKFNNSLINDETFTNTFKNVIQNMINELNTNTSLDNQLKWELLKYEIRRFTISYCKQRNKKDVAERKYLENKLKNLENVLDNYDNLESYHNIKNKIEEIHEKKAKGARIRSKCLWYEEGEKLSKFFLNLEKRRGIQGQIRKLIVNNQEITHQNKIQNELLFFFETLFKNKPANTSEDCESFLSEASVPKLNYEDAIICVANLNELELLKALKSMQNKKSPGNDGLTKEFYEMFWNEIKNPFMNSIMEAREKNKSSTSQRQAVIKLIEKKERDKRFIKNWRPISLLNVHYKFIAKALATRLKETLPKLISFQQTAYVRNRFIGEGGRLISDILEMSESLNLKGYIVTVDIEKAFDSLSHSFLLVCLKKHGYGNVFTKWVEILLECQESCIINGGNTIYFKLQNGARQGDPISAYLFILCLEIVFILIKANKRVKGINIFEHTYLYSAYVDDTTFFLRDKRSIKELINTLAAFSKYPGLKANHEKCEIAGIGVLISVKVAVCGMKCIDLCTKKMIMK